MFETARLQLKPRTGFVRWMQLERRVWALAFCGWRKSGAEPKEGAAFTHHRQTNWTAVALVLSALVVIEGTVVHLWLHGAGYDGAKWLLLGFHVYLFVWIVGDARALRHYTTHIDMLPDGGRVLVLRVGLRGSANIVVAHIAAATTGTWDEGAPGGELVTVSGYANVSLTFARPVEFVPMWARPRKIESLRLQIDDPEAFVRALGVHRGQTYARDAARAD